MAYPTNSREINRLVKIYKDSYLNILKTINVNNIYGRDNFQKVALLAQVQTELNNLDSTTKIWIEKNVPNEYRVGAAQALKDLKKIGLPVEDFTFSMLHQDAVKLIADDMYSHFAEALKTVRRDVERTFTMVEKQELMNQIGQGITTGATRKEVVSQVKTVLDKQGVSALIDKGGKRWQLDNYAEMLTRTKMAETQRLGAEYTMMENGHDLVQVSAHMTSCASCALVEGKIYSLTGTTPGYPTFEQIKGMSEHIFGPNCRHRSVPYSPMYDDNSEEFQKLSNKNKAIDEKTLKNAGFVKSDTTQGQKITRPAHQIAIEAAMNAGQFAEAWRIVNTLPANDPYKESMTKMLNEIAPQ